MVMDHRQLYQFFRGCWKLNRDIKSLADGKTLQAKMINGSAAFMPVCTESGSPSVPGYINMENDTANYSEKLTDLPTRDFRLFYRESGHLDNILNPVASGSVSRSYLYDFTSADILTVYHSQLKSSNYKSADLNTISSIKPEEFELQHLFHTIQFNNMSSYEELMDNLQQNKNAQTEFTHFCDPDTYKGYLEILDPSEFSVQWHVTGPHKSYSIQSLYTKNKSTGDI